MLLFAASFILIIRIQLVQWKSCEEGVLLEHCYYLNGCLVSTIMSATWILQEGVVILTPKNWCPKISQVCEENNACLLHVYTLATNDKCVRCHNLYNVSVWVHVSYIVHPKSFSSNGISVKSSRDILCTLFIPTAYFLSAIHSSPFHFI